MERRYFTDILKSVEVDIEKEYERLYCLFFQRFDMNGHNLWQDCEISFDEFPGKGTCISLIDFEETNGFDFEEFPRDFDENYLLNFCEYTYNLLRLTGNYCDYNMQVEKVIDLIGQEQFYDGIYTLFVPKSEVVEEVAAIVPENLVVPIWKYNYRGLNGDIEGKKQILLTLANELEPKRKDIKAINSSLEDDLFFLFNNINIRHNNTEPGKNHFEPVCKMTAKELENWYDTAYRMCLAAFLQLEYTDTKVKIAELKHRG